MSKQVVPEAWVCRNPLVYGTESVTVADLESLPEDAVMVMV
jgi:hypothetical protein